MASRTNTSHITEDIFNPVFSVHYTEIKSHIYDMEISSNNFHHPNVSSNWHYRSLLSMSHRVFHSYACGWTSTCWCRPRECFKFKSSRFYLVIHLAVDKDFIRNTLKYNQLSNFTSLLHNRGGAELFTRSENQRNKKIDNHFQAVNFQTQLSRFQTFPIDIVKVKPG